MNAYGNKIGLAHNGDRMSLNNIVFAVGIRPSDGCFYNTVGGECYNNTFGTGCNANTFGTGCCGNTFGNNCKSNSFDSSCNANTFGTGCIGNTFGAGCNNNTFGKICNGNTFGDSCSSNTFDTNCPKNVFVSDCSYLKGTYDGNAGTVTQLCHVLAGTHGSSEELYSLPTTLFADPSVTYVGMYGNGTIVTWVPAIDHAQSGQ